MVFIFNGDTLVLDPQTEKYEPLVQHAIHSNTGKHILLRSRVLMNGHTFKISFTGLNSCL